MVNTIPNRGDIVYLDFDPQAGSEHAGRRPALVLSPHLYNAKTGLTLMCPITSKQKNYPFEVVLPNELSTSGVILADHIKNLDWQARKVQFIKKLPTRILEEVIGKLQTLIAL